MGERGIARRSVHEIVPRFRSAPPPPNTPGRDPRAGDPAAHPGGAQASIEMIDKGVAEAGHPAGRGANGRKASDANGIDNALDDLKRQGVDGLLVLSNSYLNANAGRIAGRALRHSLPTCFAYREPTEAGGLIGYGASRTEASFQSGIYVGRILKGERPSDLPVLSAHDV